MIGMNEDNTQEDSNDTWRSLGGLASNIFSRILDQQVQRLAALEEVASGSQTGDLDTKSDRYVRRLTASPSTGGAQQFRTQNPLRSDRPTKQRPSRSCCREERAGHLAAPSLSAANAARSEPAY
jgi:hypothetical protein